MKAIERILDVIAPYECLCCGEEGSLLCVNCKVGSCENLPSRCYRCKKLTKDFAVCTNCRRVSSLQNVWVRTLYKDIAKQLIYQMKFRSSRRAAEIVAELTNETLPYLPRNVVIVGVPTATSRKRQRGYDHAKTIAKYLAKHNGLPHENLLIRVGQTRQVGKGRQDRLLQLKGSFFATKNVHDKSILLVDDIITTGGTLESAAEELKRAGAKKVYGVVFAQK